MKAGVIIQARMGSSRLHGKTLLAFYQGKSMLEIIIENIKKYNDFPIIVATSVSREDSRIENLCKKLGIECFRGDEENVLERIIQAARRFSIDPIIRVCADNPFIDAQSFSSLLAEMDLTDDYVAYIVNGIVSIKTHYGFWGEVVRLEALQKALKLSTEKKYLEHVTNFIYEHSEIFKLKLIPYNESELLIDSVRLTIDSEEDFNISREVYSAIVDYGYQLSPKNVMKYLQTRQDLLSIMADQKRRYLK